MTRTITKNITITILIPTTNTNIITNTIYTNTTIINIINTNFNSITIVNTYLLIMRRCKAIIYKKYFPYSD